MRALEHIPTLLCKTTRKKHLFLTYCPSEKKPFINATRTNSAHEYIPFLNYHYNGSHNTAESTYTIHPSPTISHLLRLVKVHSFHNSALTLALFSLIQKTDRRFMQCYTNIRILPKMPSKIL